MTEQQANTAGRRLLSPAEVADYFGVHRQTVYTWLRTGRLRSYKIGHRTIRVPLEDVERLARESRQGEAFLHGGIAEAS